MPELGSEAEQEEGRWGGEIISGRVEERSLLEGTVRWAWEAELSVWLEQRAKRTVIPEEAGQYLTLRIQSVFHKESYRGVLSKGVPLHLCLERWLGYPHREPTGGDWETTRSLLGAGGLLSPWGEEQTARARLVAVLGVGNGSIWKYLEVSPTLSWWIGCAGEGERICKMTQVSKL